jgi:hypothetical protein
MAMDRFDAHGRIDGRRQEIAGLALVGQRGLLPPPLSRAS